MRKRTMQGVTVLRRVRDFLAGLDLPLAVGQLAKHVEELGAIIDQLSTHAIAQESRGRAAKAGTDVKRRALTVLRQEYMRPVARVARGLFPNDVEMQRALQMPKFRDHERLLMAAYAMIDRVTPHLDLFLKKGFLPDFADRFRKAADAFKQAIDTYSADVGVRAASSAGQLEALRQGRELVGLLDAMVTPRLQHAPDLLAAWRNLTRFRMVPGAAEAPAGEDTTGTTPTPSATGPTAEPAPTVKQAEPDSHFTPEVKAA